MKVFTILMVMLLCSLGLSATVDPYDIVVLQDPTNNTIVFRSTIPLPEITEMLILNASDQPAFSQQLPANAFLNKRFTARSLPNGAYTLVFKAATGKTEIPLNISDKEFDVNRIAARRISYPVVQLRQDRLLVVNYKNETGKRVNVRLTDAEGNELFSEKIEGAQIRRSYLLEQLEAGDYLVTVSSKSVKNYTAAIALD